MNEITGVRGWILGYDGDGYALHSVATTFYWRGPVEWSHKPPGQGDGYGLYSLRPSLRSFRAIVHSYEQVIVTGRVALLGHVVEHQHGFRSAGAVIRALRLVRLPRFGTQDPDLIAGALADRYACDVSFSAHIKAWRTRRRQILQDGLFAGTWT